MQQYVYGILRGIHGERLFDTIRLYMHGTPVKRDIILQHSKDSIIQLAKLLPMGQSFMATAASDSMEPTIRVMQEIRILRVPFDIIQTNDIIAYVVRKRRKIIVHRVIKVLLVKGQKAVVTKGDKFMTPDTYRVKQGNFIGKVLV